MPSITIPADRELYDFADDPSERTAHKRHGSALENVIAKKKCSQTYRTYKRARQTAPEDSSDSDDSQESADAAKIVVARKGLARIKRKTTNAQRSTEMLQPLRYKLKFVAAPSPGDSTQCQEHLPPPQTQQPDTPTTKRLPLSQLLAQLQLPRSPRSPVQPRNVKRSKRSAKLQVDTDLIYRQEQSLDFVGAQEAVSQKRAQQTARAAAQRQAREQVADEVPITQRPCVTRQASAFSDDDDAYWPNRSSNADSQSSQSESSESEGGQDQSDGEYDNASEPEASVAPCPVPPTIEPKSILSNSVANSTQPGARHAQLLARRLSGRRVSFIQIPASPSPSAEEILPASSSTKTVEETQASRKTLSRARATSLRHDRFVLPDTIDSTNRILEELCSSMQTRTCDKAPDPGQHAPVNVTEPPQSPSARTVKCPPLCERRVTIAAPFFQPRHRTRSVSAAESSFKQVRDAWDF